MSLAYLMTLLVIEIPFAMRRPREILRSEAGTASLAGKAVFKAPVCLESVLVWHSGAAAADLPHHPADDGHHQACAHRPLLPAPPQVPLSLLLCHLLIPRKWMKKRFKLPFIPSLKLQEASIAFGAEY